jgi:hypothetical protein
MSNDGGGSYVKDPKTGKVKRVEAPTAPAGHVRPIPPAPAPAGDADEKKE